MSLQNLHTVLDYNYRARDRMYEVLECEVAQLGAPPAKSLDLIASFRSQGARIT
jgi:hypothetical protein